MIRILYATIAYSLSLRRNASCLGCPIGPGVNWLRLYLRPPTNEIKSFEKEPGLNQTWLAPGYSAAIYPHSLDRDNSSAQ